MPQERRNVISQVLPLFLGFTLTLIPMVVGSYMITRDGVRSNAQALLDNEKDKIRFENHISQYHTLEDRTTYLEGRLTYNDSMNTELKLLLRENAQLLTEVNLTLTSSTAAITKELESINRRLDKGGL